METPIDNEESAHTTISMILELGSNSTWLDSTRLDSTRHVRLCRASRASRASRDERVERDELCSSTSSTQPKCMGSTRRMCRVESSRVESSQVEFEPYGLQSHKLLKAILGNKAPRLEPRKRENGR